MCERVMKRRMVSAIAADSRARLSVRAIASLALYVQFDGKDSKQRAVLSALLLWCCSSPTIPCFAILQVDDVSLAYHNCRPKRSINFPPSFHTTKRITKIQNTS